jgi:hypothetical protein
MPITSKSTNLQASSLGMSPLMGSNYGPANELPVSMDISNDPLTLPAPTLDEYVGPTDPQAPKAPVNWKAWAAIAAAVIASAGSLWYFFA